MLDKYLQQKTKNNLGCICIIEKKKRKKKEGGKKAGGGNIK